MMSFTLTGAELRALYPDKRLRQIEKRRGSSLGMKIGSWVQQKPPEVFNPDHPGHLSKYPNYAAVYEEFLMRIHYAETLDPTPEVGD